MKLLVTALLAMPFFGIQAFEWTNVGGGDSVISAELGLTSNGSYLAGDDGEPTVPDVVDISCELDQDGLPIPLEISGDVILGTGTDEDLTVNINTPVVMKPYANAEGASLTFETTAGKKITVNVDYDLTFRGLDTREPAPMDLHVVFKGAGQTIFKMADGTVIKFDGETDTSTPAVIDPTTGLIMPREDATYSANASGTKVFVLMDQTKEQVDAGENKVVFERKNDAGGMQRTMIYVGPNSVFTYLSDNATADDGINTVGAYNAAVGINTSNTVGTGRMVLFVKGAYKTDTTRFAGGEDDAARFPQMTEKYPFNDGAIVVAGHSVTDFDAATIRTAALDDASGYNFSAPAGVNAILRVIKVDPAVKIAVKKGKKDTKTIEAGPRGLLVINDCQNMGKFASDPYKDFGTENFGAEWAYLNKIDKNVRLGFVLGVNGVLDVYDNAFVDYVGGASNDVDYLAAADFDATYIKKHNPSAFMVDGIDQSVYADANARHPFAGADAAARGAAALSPQIILRGNAKAMFKNASVSTSPYMTADNAFSGFGNGYLFNFWVRYPEISGIDAIADADIDFNKALALGAIYDDGSLQKAGYDGYQLENLVDDATGILFTKTGEGEIALDVEGPLTVTSKAADGTVLSAIGSGVITLASVLTDYAGREINIDEAGAPVVITRPLLYNDTDKYVRYNSPGLFMNDKMSLFNTTFAHTDATKFVNGKTEESEPAITGGERLFFTTEQYPGYAEFLPATDSSDAITFQQADADRYRFPEFRLFNSELALHETLCASGVRFVAMDAPFVPATAGSNTSVIRFYDHGEALDGLNTGYGRLFMLGSELNLMEGEIAGPNYVTQSAFINVFKRNKPVGPTGSSTVKLALRNGNEFPVGVSSADRNRQRSTHTIFMGIPTNVAGAQVGMFVGWPTVGKLNGDTFDFPIADSRMYPYKDEVFSETDKDVYWFKLNAIDADLPAAHAELAIEGNSICVTAQNNAGVGAFIPVKDESDNGNVYVDFGGKMTITESPVDVRTGLTTKSFNTSWINTNIPVKTWNDYDIDGVVRFSFFSGDVNLPSNQVTFAGNYGIQPYGLTANMIGSNVDALGFTRLPTCEEMNIGWFYRDPAIGQLAKSRIPSMRPDYIMYVGAGSDVQQMRVSGATINDPFNVDISGDGARPKVARVREFSSLASTRAQKFIGEGQHGIIFAEFGGRFGLGSTEWNSNSLNAWNVLGEDYVTIAPLGSCTIDVNEDVVIADDLPFMPMMRKSAVGYGFGDFTDAAIAADPNGALYHRMTIRSETEREVRVLAGTVLDLSGFGQGNRRQEIAFGGKVKLVFEEGASIRFPKAEDVAGKGGVVLYFNDESQLVFEGINEAISSRYYSAATSDENRIKIFGKGQIWLNKNSKIKVFGTASVAVQADATTPTTDFTISMQRQSQFVIGDANMPGGVFQVGNTVPVADSSINFLLLINGADATFHTDREGFFGLGAGIINKPGSKMNGNASVTNNPQVVNGKASIVGGFPVFSADGVPAVGEEGAEFASGNAWQIIPLSNVANVNVTVTNGIIEHKSIANGSSSDASLWAFGPFSGTGTIKLNASTSAIIRGGGNVMMVPALMAGTSFIPVNLWDFAGTTAASEENGSFGETYGILASAPVIGKNVASTAIVSAFNQGASTVLANSTDLFNFLTYQPFGSQAGSRYVNLGATQFSTAMDFVNAAQAGEKYDVLVGDVETFLPTIYRITSPAVIAGKVEDSLKSGVLATRADSNANPTSFTVVQ